MRVAVLSDFPDEGWPSMDLCGEMLLEHLPRDGPDAVRAERLCPGFRRLVPRLPLRGARRAAFNADRILNRFLVFPRHARRMAARFDLFHVVDHTYAQLVDAVAPGRAGVYCHDLDAFGCLLEPAAHPRPRWFRALSRRILAGMQNAAVVFHSTEAVGEQLRRRGLIAAERLVLAPYGTAPEFVATSPASPVTRPWLEGLGGGPWLLHVGSGIPRKRIDVLLDVVAAVRRAIPEVRLVKVGGEWTAQQRGQMARLGLEEGIRHAVDLSRTELAEVYRRAAVVLVPSEAEGFGLPVIEALACGTRVVASDLPTLREAGGAAATFAPVGDVDAWTDAVVRLLTTPDEPPARSQRLQWAARFSWSTHAQTIARAYHKIL